MKYFVKCVANILYVKFCKTFDKNIYLIKSNLFFYKEQIYCLKVFNKGQSLDFFFFNISKAFENKKLFSKKLVFFLKKQIHFYKLFVKDNSLGNYNFKTSAMHLI